MIKLTQSFELYAKGCGNWWKLVSEGVTISMMALV